MRGNRGKPISTTAAPEIEFPANDLATPLVFLLSRVGLKKKKNRKCRIGCFRRYSVSSAHFSAVMHFTNCCFGGSREEAIFRLHRPSQVSQVESRRGLVSSSRSHGHISACLGPITPLATLPQRHQTLPTTLPVTHYRAV